MTALWSSVGKIEVPAPLAFTAVADEVIASLARGADVRVRNRCVAKLLALLFPRLAALRSGAYPVLLGEDAACEMKCNATLVARDSLSAHFTLHDHAKGFDHRHKQDDTLRSGNLVRQ